MSYPNAPQPPPGYPPQPPYGPGTPAPQQPRHLRGYGPLLAMWITLAAAVVLFVVGGIVLATKSLGQVNDFQRVSIAAGSGTVQLDRTGTWIGYYEASDVSNSIERIPNIQVQVLDPQGQPVDLQPYGNRKDGKIDKLTYDYNNHHGAAAFEFAVHEKGRYAVNVEAGERVPSDAKIAFGSDIAAGTVAGALLIVGGVLCLIAAIVLLIVGLVKRSHHKRELRSGPYYGQPAPFGTPPPGYPAGSPPGYQPPPTGYQPPPPDYQPPPPDYQPPPPDYQPPPPDYQPPPPGYQPPPTGYQPPTA